MDNTLNVKASQLPYLRGLKLAHPVSNDEQFQISMLIGADYYWDIVQDHTIRGKGPTAVKSHLGYLLSGPVTGSTRVSTHTISTSMLNVLIQHKAEECKLEQFWELESLGVKTAEESSKSPAIDFYEEYKEKCIEYYDKQYTAKLPWKEEFNELPTNYSVAKRRTQNMIQRLSRDTGMLQAYGKIIAEQEKRGFIEKVDPTETPPNKVHYIPHHAVKKESSTTPIRIVYDCSCRETSEKNSLNDCLKSIPPLLNDLTGILARFRLHPFAATTDIEKAFLNIKLHDDDKDVTRFFWLSNPDDPNSSLITYRFRVVLFGTTCSPSMLNATLMKHLQSDQSFTSEVLKRDLYVDNVLSSFPDKQSLFTFYLARPLHAAAGFNLRSWGSNDTELQSLATSDKCIDQTKTLKILGLKWNVQTDKLMFQDNLSFTENIVCTKRETLKQSSSVYDPLGILSPITVKTKILMQSVWEQKFDWDVPLPEEIKSRWYEMIKDLKQSLGIEIPRCLFGKTKGNYSLHIFTDASQSAYGTCAYLVTEEESALVMARNRVAPLKLELMGAVLGARLAKHLIQNLNLNENTEVHFWTDSQIVFKMDGIIKAIEIVRIQSNKRNFGMCNKSEILQIQILRIF